MRLPELALIEGFYGRPWTWQERTDTVRFLAPHGFRTYLYAPKADAYLRRRWREQHPVDVARPLAAFAAAVREAGARFGVGLSPYEAWLDFGAEAKQALEAKLRFLDELRVDDLAILFDDMRGDVPDLAERQLEIVDFIADRTAASRLIVCPTYYSDDPVLDRVFGARPRDYLARLGQSLDPRIDIFWTGEEVVSRQISIPHVDRVVNELRRKPFLWDNYPVNDGQRMSQYLHLRAFTGRPAALADHVSAHGINVALQPTLTCIPALTLIESYASDEGYAYGAAFRRAAEQVLGADLATMLWQDLLVLQDVGLDRLGEKEALLRGRWRDVDHPAAREIIDWLDGGYRITDEIVHTQ
ncbi:MAG TPA: beta-N-acetylglucosaminidase domain-containing protein [Longimicrobiales bacterium]